MKKFENYESALQVLEQAPAQDLSNEFIQGGIIDKFFIQFELGWKLLKELLAYEGDPLSATGSPRQVIKGSYQYFNFMDEDLWLSMLQDRNNMAHVYDEKSAIELMNRILARYLPEFVCLRDGLVALYGADFLNG